MNLVESIRKGPGRIRILPAFAFMIAMVLTMGMLEVFAQGKTSSTTGKKSSAAKKSTSKKPKRTASRSRGQNSPTPDRIREIQAKLADKGYYSGEPSGRWDSATITAMQKFQESQNLKPTGKLDALTLQKLGLGSPVAGLAPPQKAGPLSSNR